MQKNIYFLPICIKKTPLLPEQRGMRKEEIWLLLTFCGGVLPNRPRPAQKV